MTQAEQRRPLAIVTAGARRLGRALALRLGQLGHDVAILFNRSERDAQETVSALTALGVEAEAIACDLSDPAAIDAAFARVLTRFGGAPDVLVNNAALFEWDDIHSVSWDSLTRHFEVNLFSAVLLSKHLAAQRRAEGQGLIVNVLDQKLFNPHGDHLSYTLAKYALHGLTLTMAKSLAPAFRVCGIAPGYVLPPAQGDPANFARLHNETPLRRGATAEDVAYALEFLVSSPAVTGNVLIVDGGVHMVAQARDFAFL